MGFFATKIAAKSVDVLDKTVGIIGKSVVDKDKAAELKVRAIELNLADRKNARTNQTGVAKWVRAAIAILMVAFYFGMDVYFLRWLLNNIEISIELKATFFFKVLADVTMLLVMALSFYFGNSDNNTPEVQEVGKTVKKLN